MIVREERHSTAALEARLQKETEELELGGAEAVLPRLEAIAAAAGTVPNDELQGRAWYTAARACVQLGQLERAVLLIDAAAVAFEAAQLPVQAARTDLGRMHVLDDLGHHDEAIAVGEAAQRKLAGLRATADLADAELDRLEAALLENLGASHGYKGEHGAALRAYDRAVQIYEARGFTADRIRCIANAGIELIELGQADPGVQRLESAEAHFRADGHALAAAKCAAHAARGHLAVGHFDAAQRALDRSASGLSVDSLATEDLRAQLTRADVYLGLNLIPEALELYAELRRAFSAQGLAHDTAHAARGCAIALHRAGEAERAAAMFEVASDGFSAVGDRALHAVTQVEQARSLRRAEPHALLAAARTLGALGRRRDEADALLATVELGVALDPSHTMALVSELLDHLDAPELAWQFLFRRAADVSDDAAIDEKIALLSAAAETVDGLRGGVSDLRSRLSFLGSRRGVHEALVSTLLDAGRDDDAYEHTAAARSRCLNEDRTPVAAAPADRDLGGLVVVYEVLGDEVLAYARTPSSLTVHRRLSSLARLRELLLRLDAQWQRYHDPSLASEFGADLERSSVRVLEQLHRELVAPIVDGGRDPLCIVPVGPIANVPFAALYDGLHHLVERTEVTVAPSVPSAALHWRTPLDPDISHLFVGVPDDRAPLIRDEVEMLASTVSQATLLLGEHASADVVAAAAQHHGVLHLACHGENRPDNPLLSGLRLGDRWVTAAEIAEWSLGGQLVVLSSCDSGRQHAVGNIDETVGLPRAFLRAGARGVVVNHWKVNDRSAFELMSRFYRQLCSLGPSGALRSAQNESLTSGLHPHAWGAPTLYLQPSAASEAPHQ